MADIQQGRDSEDNLQAKLGERDSETEKNVASEHNQSLSENQNSSVENMDELPSNLEATENETTPGSNPIDSVMNDNIASGITTMSGQNNTEGNSTEHTEESQPNLNSNEEDDKSMNVSLRASPDHQSTLDTEPSREACVADKVANDLPSVEGNTMDATGTEKKIQLTEAALESHGEENQGITENTSGIHVESSKIENNEIQQIGCSPGAVSNSDPLQSVYYLKRFQWKGEAIQIVTQNENGPCPLLAIANVLVLTKRIMLPWMQECISATQLMEYIGDYILTAGPKNVDEAVLLNYQQNMHDAISIMYKLQTGIDVNVRFTGPRDFELTPECLVFDLLNIGLYHGWLVDPQDLQMVEAVGNLSYNQLVEKIIKSKEENSDGKDVSEGLLAENFLDQAASQLTYHGLCELNNAIENEELCVFFRNNHFSTLYKYKEELFLLVTDQGYLNQSQIIWETLANVDGDGQFVDETFRTVGPMTYQQPYNEPKPKTETQLSQEDRDYLIALSLQEENRATDAQIQVPIQTQQQQLPPPLTAEQQEANDLEFARRLQAEENRVARQEQIQQQQQQHRPYNPQPPQPIPAQRHHYPAQQPQQHSPRQREVQGSTADKCTIL